ncbi:hypothetical protein MCC93_23590 [Morococcus cerebrosus]|uniref:Uncharacterized protein n=1 Tax=Morococcus cerebrosus TaxID=1056807 RepID=A0A0C1GL22_9NEIS|nr:hypothetical protein MCC93_23590 [Morococcus cerebrosus]
MQLQYRGKIKKNLKYDFCVWCFFLEAQSYLTLSEIFGLIKL